MYVVAVGDEVLTPTEARGNFADIVRRARAGEDILIGSNNVPIVRLTGAVERGDWHLPKDVLVTMLRTQAAHDANRIASGREPGAPTEKRRPVFPPPEESGPVFEWLLNLQDRWPVQDYVLTVLFAVRARQVAAGSPPSSLDQILALLTAAMRMDLTVGEALVFGELRHELRRRIQLMAPADLDEILEALPERAPWPAAEGKEPNNDR
uniref:type II toxin-antitoxin system prevent-host-death family antitoxin n=1 Tax=Nocardia suismassiliense TaxID=2077092 RepID=UPI003F49545E